MSTNKKVALAIYAVLAVLAVTMGDSGVGVWSLRLLGILALAHAIELVVFFNFCRKAGGSLAWHLLNVFLFGVLHVGEVKAEQAAAR